MVQKAAKQLAARNAAILNRMHLISLLVNAVFTLIRFFFFKSSCTFSSYILYVSFSLPTAAIQLWFEKNGRPRDGRAADDLDAKGATEYMFDVLWWTWGTMIAVMLFGDRAWWMWIATPIYLIYLSITTFRGVRQTMGGFGGQESAADEGPTSNRQRKIAKKNERGGNR